MGLIVRDAQVFLVRMVGTAPFLPMTPTFMAEPFLTAVVELIGRWTVRIGAKIGPEIAMEVGSIMINCQLQARYSILRTRGSLQC